MFTRLVRFTLEPGNRPAAKELADMIIPLIRAQHGCQAVRLIMEEGGDNFGLIIEWAAKEDADAASQVVAPKLMPAIAAMATSPAVVQLFEDYEPTG